MARPKLNPDFVEKICPTCNNPFKVSFYKRKIQVFCSKVCAQHHPDTLAKMAKSQKETFDQRYDGKHPMQTEPTVANFKQTMIKKYGVEHALCLCEFAKKSADTKQRKYGDSHYNNTEQMKQTCLERYGVSNFMQTQDYKTKTRETCLRKYGVDHPSKTRRYKLAHCKNMFAKFLNHERFSNFEPMFKLEEYDGVTKLFNKKYSFRCKRCGDISDYFIDDGKSPMCVSCDKNNMSSFQKEIVDYVREIIGQDENIVVNDRTILYPKEIDIYIPSKKIAIECNGLYWHSECLGRKNKVYHLNKMKKCLLKEIRLVQIWEDEWKFKNAIVKSVLKNALSNNPNKKVYARECELKTLNKKESDEFLINNHLQGKDVSSIKFGLYHKNELVSVMTFCKSRFDKKIEWEMSRFCNKIDTQVIGGASRLFSHFINTFDPKSITSYSDRRFFTGNLYTQLGFSFFNNSSPNYFYIMGNYASSKNRMSFQKHKLKNLLPDFDPVLTEWQNMQNHGFDRIWDCGNSKWVWKKEIKPLSL